jgi:hypothetical protein
VATQSVLGVPKVRPPLLDDLSHATGGGSSSTRTSTTRQASDPVISRAQAMNLMPDIDDEEDEVLEDEEFDEDSESDEDDEDLDEESDEEEETWQVARVLTS